MSKPRGAPAAVAIVPEDVEMNVIRPSGRVLPGTLTVPQGVERKEGPVVVFLHGTHSNKDHNFVPDLAAKLCKDHGIRSFRFDFRVDKSEEEPEHRYRFSGYKDDLDDMEVAVAQLQRSGYTPFCLFGHSRGANDALLYASTRLARGADGNANAVPDNVFARLGALSVSDAPSCASPPSPADILLNPAQLCLVCAAPRFNMPNMLPTLFAAEKVALLATEGQFVWNEVHTCHSPLGLVISRPTLLRVHPAYNRSSAPW
jgi:pimeloyl-ACP methyl ester carboxylesterase